MIWYYFFRNFFTAIHAAEEFLPWHRWYILEFENLLKEVDCRAAAVYWDWSVVSNDPWNNAMLFSDQEHGFGSVIDERFLIRDICLFDKTHNTCERVIVREGEFPHLQF